MRRGAPVNPGPAGGRWASSSWSKLVWLLQNTPAPKRESTHAASMASSPFRRRHRRHDGQERAQLLPATPDVSLEELVREDNFYRRLEAGLDLSFVCDLVRPLYGRGGRPSVGPMIFFKLQLVLFFEGLRSERELMRRRGRPCRRGELRGRAFARRGLATQGGPGPPVRSASIPETMEDSTKRGPGRGRCGSGFGSTGDVLRNASAGCRTEKTKAVSLRALVIQGCGLRQRAGSRSAQATNLALMARGVEDRPEPPIVDGRPVYMQPNTPKDTLVGVWLVPHLGSILLK